MNITSLWRSDAHDEQLAGLDYIAHEQVDLVLAFTRWGLERAIHRAARRTAREHGAQVAVIVDASYNYIDLIHQYQHVDLYLYGRKAQR